MKYFQKRNFAGLLLIACIGLFGVSQTSCKTKEGCPVNEYTAKTDKKGNFKRGSARSGLFPKKMNKKVKRKKN